VRRGEGKQTTFGDASPGIACTSASLQEGILSTILGVGVERWDHGDLEAALLEKRVRRGKVISVFLKLGGRVFPNLKVSGQRGE